MTITSTQNRITYAGNGAPGVPGVTAFSVPFRFLAPGDLVVLVRDNATGVDITKTLDTDYSVAGEGAAAGGTVTFLIEDGEPQTGETLIIYGNPALTQTVDYISGGVFPAETHEQAMDLLTLQGIRTREIADRSLSLTDSSTDGSGEYDANSNRIKSLGTPTATTDATTKTYVDALVNNTALGPEPTGLIATGSTTSRTLADRWGDIPNVKDFGAVGDGVTDDTVAIQAAIDACEVLHFPAATYRLTHLTIAKDVRIVGDGWNETFLEFTTTSQDGITWTGAASLGLNSVGLLEGIALKYVGAGASGKVGIKLSRKVNMREVVVDNFTSHGLELVSVDAATQTPYFCLFESVRFINNGGSGCMVNDGCNANTWANCQFSSNDEHGFHQKLTSVAVYGSVITSGQASYNQKNGYFFDGGTNYSVHGTYAEYNNASNTGGTGPLLGTYKDFFIADNVSNSCILMGTLTNQEIGRVRLNTVSNNQFWLGGVPQMGFDALSLGQENVGAGRIFKFEGAGGAVHQMLFREGTQDIFSFHYDGSGASPTNLLKLRSASGASGLDTDVLVARQDGSLLVPNMTTVVAGLDTGELWSWGGTVRISPPSITALADEATPTVAGGSIFVTSGTANDPITDFDDGFTGQTITILAEHAVTITDGTNIILHGSADFDMAASDSLTLVLKADNKWYETARMVN